MVQGKKGENKNEEREAKHLAVVGQMNQLCNPTKKRQLLRRQFLQSGDMLGVSRKSLASEKGIRKLSERKEAKK